MSPRRGPVRLLGADADVFLGAQAPIRGVDMLTAVAYTPAQLRPSGVDGAEALRNFSSR